MSIIIISPSALMQVAKKLVDSFESGGRLPSCQLRIKRRGKAKLEDLEYMVRLKGAKKPSDFFLMIIALEYESTPQGMHIGSGKCCMHSGGLCDIVCAVPTDVSPPPQRSSVSSRHHYTSGVSDNTAGPSTSRDEGKSLRMPILGNLFLIRYTCTAHGKSSFGYSLPTDVSPPVQRSSGKRSQEHTGREEAGLGAEEAFPSDPKQPKKEGL